MGPRLIINQTAHLHLRMDNSWTTFHVIWRELNRTLCTQCGNCNRDVDTTRTLLLTVVAGIYTAFSEVLDCTVTLVTGIIQLTISILMKLLLIIIIVLTLATSSLLSAIIVNSVSIQPTNCNSLNRFIILFSLENNGVSFM